MEENIEHETLNNRLRFALNNQIEWQKYAEAKNLVLFTLSGGTLVAIFDKYKDVIASPKPNPILDNVYFEIFIVTTTIAFCICIFSFLYFRWLGLYRKMIKSESESKNIFIISWDYVKDRKDVEELDRLAEKYDPHKHRKDLLFQHFYGSKLTYLKYRCFNSGIVIYMIGLLVLTVKFIAAWFKILI